MHHRIAFPLLFQIAFNLMPVYGVMMNEWTIFSVIYLYWLETLILSAFSFIKIVSSKGSTPNEKLKMKFPAKDESKWKTGIRFLIIRIGLLLFYLLFIFLFVGLLISDKADMRTNIEMAFFMNPIFNLTLMLYTLSVGMDLMWHFYGNGEYLRVHPSDNASLFDGRTIVIHVAMVLGVLGFMYVKEHFPNHQHLAKLYFISIFVLIKTITDVVVYYVGRKPTVVPSTNS